MTGEWRNNIAGARMQVDQQFNDRILASEFTNQEWGLIMTAVEFDIVGAEDPETATLVADTENVRHVIPELENIPRGMGGQPGQGGRDSSGGLLGSIRGLFGGGDSKDEHKLEAAAALAEEYATELESYLREQDRWEAVCASAADG